MKLDEIKEDVDARMLSPEDFAMWLNDKLSDAWADGYNEGYDCGAADASS